MKANYLLLTLPLTGVVLAPAVQADQLRRSAHRHNFSTDVSRTVSNGKTYNRHTEQTVNDNGYEYHGSHTNTNGKTATRAKSVSVDKENNTVTKEVSGEGFNGKSYESGSAESVSCD
ncbi:MAG TPA: hypothetical protein VFV48_08945 [Pseudomonadales bacterium]|nr:hypothetical protein [Pseudomonadales bacterium]